MGAIFDNKVSEIIFTSVEADIHFAPVSSINYENGSSESRDSPESDESNQVREIESNTDNLPDKSLDTGLKRKSKIIKFDDSDCSDTETNTIDKDIDGSCKNDTDGVNKSKFLDSDVSGDECENTVRKSKPLQVESDDSDIEKPTDQTHTKRFSNLIDSDTESDNEKNAEDVEVCKVSNKSGANAKKKTYFESRSDSEDEPQIFNKDSLSHLCDPDTSEDENTDTRTDRGHASISNTKSVCLPKKMTGKEALEQRREIKSESQRMLRESRVSIPYHKPKPRSLKEFLMNRPRISDPIPESMKSLSPSIAIKVATQQLKVISEKLEEREKIVKEFYKSESESEPETNDTNGNDENVESKNGNDKIELENRLNNNYISNNDPKDSEENSYGEENKNKETDLKHLADSQEHVGSQEYENSQEHTDSQEHSDSKECGNIDKPMEISEQSSSKIPDLTINHSEDLFNDECMDISNENIENKADKSSNGVISGKSDMTKYKSENGTVDSDNTNIDLLSESSEPRTELKSKKETKSILFRDLFNSANCGITQSQLKEALLKSFTAPSNLIERDSPTPVYLSLYGTKRKRQRLISPVKEREEIPDSSSNVNKNVDMDSNDKIDEFVNSLFGSESPLKSVTAHKNFHEMHDENSNSVSSFSHHETKTDTLSQDIPKLTNSQLDDLMKKYGSTEKKSIWDDLSAFSKLDDDDDITFEPTKKIKPVENIKPKLSGDPDTVIDLDGDIEKPKGMSTLMKRFMNHVTKKQTEKKKVEFKVMSTEGGKIHEDKVVLSSDKVDDEGVGAGFEKPGIKLMRLKGDLRQQIMQRRSEEWAKKEQELKILRGEDEEEFEDIYQGEKDECCSDGEDKNNNEENASEAGDEEEDEEVEDDVEIRDQPRKTKSAFVDEEAEEDDDFEVDVDENEDFDENEDVEEEEETEVDDENDATSRSPKKLRRIKVAFEDDSDSDKEIEEMKKAAEEAVDRAIECTETPKRNGSRNETDTFLTQTGNNSDCEDEIPVHQRTMQCTPVGLDHRKSLISSEIKSDNFVSPVLKLTALQGMSSVTKSANSPEISQFFLPQDPSPLRCEKPAKRLFTDFEPSTQKNIEELMGLCSGNFATQNCVTTVNEPEPLLSFTGQSQFLTSLKPVTDEDIARDRLNTKKGDDDLKSALVGNLSLSMDVTNLAKKNIDEDSNTSQNFNLIWSDESDNELKNIEQKSKKETIIQTPLPSKDIQYSIVSSSDEDQDNTDKKQRSKKLKKKKQKLKFSDDENSESENDEYESNIIDDEIGDENEEVGDDVEVDYDSEENEVIVEKKAKASEFFEKEAELSESDWDSADEDEKDLDVFEREAGDDDDIDQKKVRSELERIHMRRVLDDDQREVRLLQEILLEDGELHSESGRKRQFKWRNIDDIGVDENAPPEDDNENGYDEDDDTEEQWRRMRHERETFLEEKRTKMLRSNESQDLLDLDLEEDDSQILRLGQAALRRSITSTTHTKTPINSNGITTCQTETSVTKSVTAKTNVLNFVDSKKPFTLVNKRGSFLARGESALARLAAITKDPTDMQVSGPKNTRNFVFTAVDPVEKLQEVAEPTEKSTPSNKTKRKSSTDGTPSILKKLRVADSLQTRSNANSRVKKLFDAM